MGMGIKAMPIWKKKMGDNPLDDNSLLIQSLISAKIISNPLLVK
jgi:hypothetical protein